MHICKTIALPREVRIKNARPCTAACILSVVIKGGNQKRGERDFKSVKNFFKYIFRIPQVIIHLKQVQNAKKYYAFKGYLNFLQT